MATTCESWRRAASMAVVATGFVAVASAQTPAGEYVGASAPARLQYRSALERYQPYKEQPVQSWRDVNDDVGRIGGWRVYAKEAAAKDGDAANGRAADPHTGHPRAKQ